MRCDLRVDQLGPDRFEAVEGALFVRPNEARIPGDIGRQDRRQPAFGARSLPVCIAYQLNRERNVYEAI